MISYILLASLARPLSKPFKEPNENLVEISLRPLFYWLETARVAISTPEKKSANIFAIIGHRAVKVYCLIGQYLLICSGFPSMEEVRQEGTEAVDKNQPRDEAPAGDGDGGQARESVQPAATVTAPPSKSKNPLDNWKIPKISKKRKNDPEIKGTSQKRTKNSKCASIADDISQDDNESRAVSSSDDGDTSDSPPPSESGDSENSSDSDEVSVGEVVPPARPTPVASGSTAEAGKGYTRFHPGEDSTSSFSLPTPDMVKYVTQLFTQYVSDKRLKDLILDEYPVPQGVPGVEVPRVDDYILDIFTANHADYGKHVDDTWRKIQGRLIDVMGPLAKVWTMLDEARQDEGAAADLDLWEILDLIEKVMTLLGQTNVSFNHFRRQNILYKMTKDNKKAKSLLKHHDPSVLQSHNKLFGKPFYRKLNKSAQIRKETKEISSQLGDHRPKKDGKKNFTKPGGNTDQPFQKGPSSRGRGGGHKVSFSKRGGKGGNRGKCQCRVSFVKTKRGGGPQADRWTQTYLC